METLSYVLHHIFIVDRNSDSGVCCNFTLNYINKYLRQNRAYSPFNSLLAMFLEQTV